MDGFNIGQSVEDGFTKTFEYLPQVLGALLILVIGYVVGKIVQRIIRRLLVKMRFNHMVTTSPVGNMASRIVDDPSRFVAKSGFWILWLGFISLAVSVLNVASLTNFVAAIYAYIPNVIAAILIFLVASAISAGTAKFVQRVLGSTPMANVLKTVGPSVIMSIAIFMILNQLGIARDIVNITYVAIMGSLSLGLALAFGLGGREHAAHLLDQAYAASKDKFGTEEFKRGARNTKTEVQKVVNRRTRS